MKYDIWSFITPILLCSEWLTISSQISHFSQECLHQCRSCSPSSDCKPRQPSHPSWWWWTQSHQIQLRFLPFQSEVSHLLRIIGPESSSTFQLIHIILLYRYWSFLHKRFIFQCCPILCYQISWSIHIIQWTQKEVMCGFGQQCCGRLSGVVSILQRLHRYFLHLVLLELLILPELMMLHLYDVLILF